MFDVDPGEMVYVLAGTYTKGQWVRTVGRFNPLAWAVRGECFDICDEVQYRFCKDVVVGN